MRRNDYGGKNDEVKRWTASLRSLFRKKITAEKLLLKSGA
jgi:hypothetical protein